MQLVKGLFIAAVLCVASASAGNSEQQQQNGKQHEISSSATSASSASDDSAEPVEQGFNVHKVSFTSSDPKEEEGEEKEGSTNYVPLVAAVGACACMGVLGAVYLKRRSDDDKLPGEIFTIDDKNSVL